MLLGLEKKYFPFYIDIGQLGSLFSPLTFLSQKPNLKKKPQTQLPNCHSVRNIMLEIDPVIY